MTLFYVADLYIIYFQYEDKKWTSFLKLIRKIKLQQNVDQILAIVASNHLTSYLLKGVEATGLAQTHQIFKDRLL